MVVFSRLLPVAATAYAVQSLGALISIPQQEDKFYITGALGFLSATLVSLCYPALKDKLWYHIPSSLPPISSFAPRQLLLNAAVAVWGVRLGTFLLRRSLKHGGDSRFDEIKKQPKRFAFYWFAQGTWIFLVGLPVYLANILPASQHPPVGLRDYISFTIFTSSFVLEVLADYQKSTWRNRKLKGEHYDKFIKSGLWSFSRHPNYVAELGIWTSIWALSYGALEQQFFPPMTPAVAAISPLFTWYLLREVSGVPPLERAAEKKFGNDPEWKLYKRHVPIFWPWKFAN